MNARELKEDVRKLEVRDGQYSFLTLFFVALFLIITFVLIVVSLPFPPTILVQLGITTTLLSAVVGFYFVKSTRAKLCTLTKTLEMYEVEWRTLLWNKIHLGSFLNAMFSAKGSVTGHFAKRLVNSCGVGPYTQDEILRACRGESDQPYFDLPGMIHLFSTGSLRWSPEGLVWSDEIRMKFFELHPMPDDFDPNNHPKRVNHSM